MRNDKIHTKNKKTGKHEVIVQSDITMVDWGFYFFVGSELEAFKAAYEYRYSKNGVKVEYAEGAGSWAVTVFNELAAKIGIDGAV